MHDLKLGDALNDNLIERFWSIIMALTPGAAGATGSGSAASTGGSSTWERAHLHTTK
jgi:ATP-dependent RNA helicase DHX8/PRP22